MANDRLPRTGLKGFAYNLRHFFSVQLPNTLRASALRKKYKLDQQILFTPQSDQKFTVAVVAIFKGEDEYLREWVEFHRIVGVEHFFLYDNSASEASKKILSPYIAEGLVTYIPFADFPENSMRSSYGKDQFHKLSMQNLAYGDCVKKYARYCLWLLKIDLDEFAYPLKPYATLGEAFSIFNPRKVKGFSLSAARFGPSGNKERSGKMVIETYTKRMRDLDRNWKVAGNGAYLNRNTGYQGCHTYFFRYAPFTRFLDDSATAHCVRINHYYIKSLAEYLDKIEFHSVGHKAGKETPDKWPRSDQEADYSDEGEILRFSAELKKRLGRIE